MCKNWTTTWIFSSVSNWSCGGRYFVIFRFVLTWFLTNLWSSDPWVPLYQLCDLDQPASPCHQYLSRFVIVQRSELCCQSYHCQITSEYSQNILLNWNWTGIVRLSHCSIPICQLRHLSLIRFIVAKTPKTLFQQIYWASDVHLISFKVSEDLVFVKKLKHITFLLTNLEQR